MTDMVERFEALYIPEPNSGCWLWLGCDSQGYGYFRARGKMVRAHRWSYEHFCGPIPKGLQIDHLCRVPRCVNPMHLEPVTSKENVNRGFVNQHKGKTHCKRGHLLSPENVYTTPEGWRQCVTCRKGHDRKRLMKKRQAMLKAALDEQEQEPEPEPSWSRLMDAGREDREQ